MYKIAVVVVALVKTDMYARPPYLIDLKVSAKPVGKYLKRRE